MEWFGYGANTAYAYLRYATYVELQVFEQNQLRGTPYLTLAN